MNTVPFTNNKVRDASSHHQAKNNRKPLPNRVSSPQSTGPPQTRIRNAHHKQQRFSLPPSIREEEDEDNRTITSITVKDNNDDDDEIPLAFLAYRKGLVIPENTFVPVNKRQQNYLSPQQQYHLNHNSNLCYTSSPMIPTTNKLYYSHPNNITPSFYQINDSPSSSNSSLSSAERHSFSPPPLQQQQRRTSSTRSKVSRRQSSHI